MMKQKENMTKSDLKQFIFKDANEIFDIKKNIFFQSFISKCESNGLSLLPITIYDVEDSFLYDSPINDFLLDCLFFNFNPYCIVKSESNYHIDHVFVFFEIEGFNKESNYCFVISMLDKMKLTSFQIFSLKQLSKEDVNNFWIM